MPQPDSLVDPLDSWPAFVAAARRRLEAGRVAYGDRSFSAHPAELLSELQQECLDLAGWGFVLFERLATAQEALQRAGGTADDHEIIPEPEPAKGQPGPSARLVGSGRAAALAKIARGDR